MPQPVMAQHLRVEIMRLETRMMNMALRPFEEKEAVVIDKFFPAVEAAEAVEVAARGIVDQL